LRKYIAFAPGVFTTHYAKTAHGVIAYSDDLTVAVIDPELAGRNTREVAPHLGRDIPIVASVREALAFSPTSLLIGLAPKGGALPKDWRDEIIIAIGAGLEIVSGLHEMLADDPEFSAAASNSGTSIWDVRKPPAVPIFSGKAFQLPACILLTVGSDAASGKMTASLELVRAAKDRGVDAVFVPTGQTGIMIAGWGIAVDRVIADFISGAAEQLVEQASTRGDFLVVEGQGGINHPAYSAVTLGLLHGSAPDALLLVHDVSRESVAGFPNVPVLPLSNLVELYEKLAGGVKPARVVGIALNTKGWSDEDARKAVRRAEEETRLPVDDVVRFGPHALYDAIAPSIKKTSGAKMTPA
jgi:uncharacterized NAD-dependent epimerase/dehydratase family protein